MGVAYGLEDTLQEIMGYHIDARGRSGVEEEPSGRMPQHFITEWLLVCYCCHGSWLDGLMIGLQPNSLLLLLPAT